MQQTGYKLVKVSTSFTRPTDTTPYTIGDSISSSTSAPSVIALDFSSTGINTGGSIEVRRIAVVSSIKGATLPLINVFASNSPITPTVDNSALDISDTISESGGAWFNLDIQNGSVSNAHVAANVVNVPMVLYSNETKLYLVLQAANAYTPANAEKFTIQMWAAIL